MKNQYLKHLDKIEFVVTDACTGRCKHCSQGDHRGGAKINGEIAAEVVKKVASVYDIKTVMTFGGEPLLNTEAVFAIMSAAKKLDIPKRQLITNGYFSKDEEHICSVASRLCDCGVNNLLLSVDAFHAETIPLNIVKIFAREVIRCEIPTFLQPAWLVSADDDNEYNRKTREILDSFKHLGIPENDGNIIFPEGNALKYLAEYFKVYAPENPYVEDVRDVRCLSVSENGDVLCGNIYSEDILDIINRYDATIDI